MLPRAYINSGLKFFKNKRRAKAFLLDVNVEGKGGSASFNLSDMSEASLVSNLYFLYEIQIRLDLEQCIKSKVRNFKIYLTNNTSAKDFAEQEHSQKYRTFIDGNPLSAASNILSSDSTEINAYLMNKNDTKKFYLTNFDPRSFVDLERYRNNFKGTVTDKFGLVSEIDTSPVPVAFTNENRKYLYTDSSSPIHSSVQTKMIRSVEKGLFEGVPITKTMGLQNLERKNRRKINKGFKATGQRDEISKALIPEFNESKNYLKFTPLLRKTANQVRNVSFTLKIRYKDLVENNINTDKFGIVLEAEDRSGLTLDRQFLRINSKRDLGYYSYDLSNINILTSIENNAIVISTQQDAERNLGQKNVKLNMHVKSLNKNEEFYKTDFSNNVLRHHIDNKNKKPTKIKIAYSESENNSRNSSRGLSRYELKTLGTPTFFRFTTSIGDKHFDNMFEVGTSSVFNSVYDNAHIPIYVRSLYNDGKSFARVTIDKSRIPVKYKKIKIFKKDLNRHLYGNFEDNLKEVQQETGETVRFLNLDNDTASTNLSNSTISIDDYNVEVGKLYEYRVELFEDIKKVGRVFSTSFFQEVIERKENVVNMSVSNSVLTPNSNKFEITCNVIESDAEKVFKSLLGNKYDLFKDELSEIKDITTSTLALRAERICIEDCTIETVKYVSTMDALFAQSENANTNANLSKFLFADSNLDKDKDYLYKFTACLKPVQEIIAGINDEISIRRAGIKNNFKPFKYAAIRRKIKNIDTQILYSLAAKISETSKGKIIDTETRHNLSNNNLFSLASTGDILYTFGQRSFSQSVRKATNASGVISINHKQTDHKRLKDRNSIGEKKFTNKFILEFDCKFSIDIDHAVVFMNSQGIYEYCCHMHVQKDKDDYRVYVEKQDLVGDVTFVLYPITKKGKVGNFVEVSTVTI